MEAAIIQEEFEEAERNWKRALKQLEEKRLADLREVKEIEVAKARADEDRKTTFLDPNTANGHQLQAPDYIWKAIFFTFQVPSGSGCPVWLRPETVYLLFRAERKMRNAKSGNLSFRAAFPVKQTWKKAQPYNQW